MHVARLSRRGRERQRVCKGNGEDGRRLNGATDAMGHPRAGQAPTAGASWRLSATTSRLANEELQSTEQKTGEDEETDETKHGLLAITG